jgi:hypothetical protein
MENKIDNFQEVEKLLKKKKTAKNICNIWEKFIL